MSGKNREAKFDIFEKGAQHIFEVQECYGLMNGPLNIMLDITNKCNLFCIHCYNNSGNNPPTKDLSDEQVLKIADQIIEMQPFVTCLCGGEPLIREELFFKLIEKFHSSRIKINAVSNGILVNKENAARMKKTGLQSLQISIDGSSSESHDTFRGMNGSWEKSLNAIEILKGQNLDVPVTFIPNQLNVKETGDTIDLMYSMGVRVFRMMPIVPIGRGFINKEKIILNPNQEWELQWTIIEKRNKYPEMQIEWGDPLEHIYLFPNNPKARTFMIEIRADGTIPLSPYIPFIAADLKKHNLKKYWESGLKDVWKNPVVHNYIKQYKNLSDFYKKFNRAWEGNDIELPNELIYEGLDEK